MGIAEHAPNQVNRELSEGGQDLAKLVMLEAGATGVLIVEVDFPSNVGSRFDCMGVIKPFVASQAIVGKEGDFAVEPFRMMEEPTNALHPFFARRIVLNAGFRHRCQRQRR
mgnify:CR=1 FL=1